MATHNSMMEMSEIDEVGSLVFEIPRARRRVPNFSERIF